MKKHKKTKWFKETRSSYLPMSWQGNLIYLSYVLYVFAIPFVWYQNGHDYWKLLVNVIPLLVAAAVLTQYVASKKS